MRDLLSKLLVAVATLTLLLGLGARPAWAGHDTEVEISFWAFSRDGRFMLVVVKDTTRGMSTLAIKAVGTYGASVFETELPPDIQPAQLPVYLAYPPFNAYGFADGGMVGEASPDGNGALMTTKMGRELQVFIGRGETMKKMFAVPLGVSPDGTAIADGKVKEVRWSATGKATAMIIHQTIVGDYAMETDQLISFDPTPYKASLGPVPPPAAATPKK